MAAKEQELGEVHRLTTEWALAVLSARDPETGRPVASAAEVAVIRAFLKDNNISADADGNDKLLALRDKLQRRHSRLQPVDPVIDLGLEPDGMVQ